MNWIEIVLGIILGLVVGMVLFIALVYTAWCIGFDHYRDGE